ncbi:MAG: serine/threonine protein kinase, partial [Labilithrix sp.]|nr:serine/threonine protein kinase [Labilithrix sp.]
MSAAKAEDCAPAPAPKLLAPGDVIDGRYRVEAYLGGGGMASVYRATHVVLEQAVAIKVIAPVIRQIPGMAQRFLREARAATHLKSEHVARVTDVGTMADGAPYMVMEYLDGRDLDAIVESGEEIAVEEAVDYVLQACEALAEVHGLGIVHRDLKPANLFLTKGADGLPCVKLIDFGISRTDSPLAPKEVAALTQPDTVMGSPRYMSPEQMESAAKADSRSDIYGIGVVLYELLTRKAPHEGETYLDIYAAATLAPPEAPSTLRPEVPRELDEVILRCLRVDPAERYADAAELAT